MVFSSVAQQHHQENSHREGKKLDLTAPLISVRRHHHLHRASPRSDLQQQHAEEGGRGDEEESASWGSLRSPGAVPFVWERTPGRPKFDSSSRNDTAFAACSSPSLPPGRRTTTWTGSSPARPDPNKPSVADVKGNHQRKKKLPLLLKESPHRKHKQSSLGELFGTKEAAPPSASVSEHDAFTEVAQSESVTADPPAARSTTTTTLASDDPSARDFILKRFLPAAKAMADESASSTPFSSPLVPATYSQQQLTPRTAFSGASPSPRKQASASVERIQTYQYKFANGTKSRKSPEDLFACGFFSFAAALRHLRPHYPSSRLKRSSDRAHNRFAADDFRTSILVKKVNGGLVSFYQEEFSEAELEDDPRPQRHQPRSREGSMLKSPAGRQNSPRMLQSSSSPWNQDRFYDCDTNFQNQDAPVLQKPKMPGRTYYRGCMSPFPEKAQDAKGFLGLPENYKPPDDPYVNGGYSPSIHQRQRADVEKDRSLPSVMNARNQSALAQKLGKTLQLDTDNNSYVGSSPSPRSINGAASAESLREHIERSPKQPPRRSSAAYQSDLHAPSPSPARNNAPVPPLLPPKSPSHSWLWKAMPLSSSPKSQAKSANWEATVKSRQLRPGHLRYSEENAFQPYV